jgi:ArsR family transcriptional regulator
MSTEMMPEPSLAKTFHALADAKRLRILEVLRSGECCVCDLAGSLDIRQSLLSFHLRTLRDAGLVRDRKEGRWVHYSLEESVLREVRDYLAIVARDVRRGRGARCCRHGSG